MFSQIRRINFNKMAMPIRKLSDSNKDVKYDMIISELQDVNNSLNSMMKFVMPAAGFYIGTGIGTFFVSLVTLLK